MSLKSERNTFEAFLLGEKEYRRNINICELCWYGPCMCAGIIHRKPSDHIGFKWVNGAWRSSVVCEPLGIDEHMAVTK